VSESRRERKGTGQRKRTGKTEDTTGTRGAQGVPETQATNTTTIPLASTSTSNPIPFNYSIGSGIPTAPTSNTTTSGSIIMHAPPWPKLQSPRAPGLPRSILAGWIPNNHINHCGSAKLEGISVSSAGASGGGGCFCRSFG
jgi:hypothetical protein